MSFGKGRIEFHKIIYSAPSTRLAAFSAFTASGGRFQDTTERLEDSRQPY